MKKIIELDVRYIRDGLKESKEIDKIWVHFDACVGRGEEREDGELVVIFNKCDMGSEAFFYGKDGERQEVELVDEDVQKISTTINDYLKRLGLFNIGPFDKYMKDLELRKTPLYGLLRHEEVKYWTIQFLKMYTSIFVGGITTEMILKQIEECDAETNGKIIISHMSSCCDKMTKSYRPAVSLRVYKEADIDCNAVRELLVDKKIEELTDEELEQIIAKEIPHQTLSDLDMDELLSCQYDINNIINEFTWYPYMEQIIGEGMFFKMVNDKQFNTGDKRRDLEDKATDVVRAAQALYAYMQI